MHCYILSVPFRIGPFSVGFGVQESKQEVTKIVSPVKWQKIKHINIGKANDKYVDVHIRVASPHPQKDLIDNQS